jgi:uncharacterized protein (TIRG00374 family)
MSRDSAPIDVPNPQAGEDADDEEMPRVQISSRQALLFGLFVVSAIALLYIVLPQLAGLKKTWHRLEEGDPWWLALAFFFEILSFGGHIWLFRAVFLRGRTRIGWRASYQITMAGLAATRLFAAAGAGGVVLTTWAVRRSGMERRVVACRMVAYLVLLYAVYMWTMVIVGLGLRWGIFAGEAPFGFTVVPAIFGAVLIAIFLAVALLPQDVERRLDRWASGSGRAARLVAKAVTIPASAASGVRTAIKMIRDGDTGVLGAVAWWAFDVATLWACLRAFGDAPPYAVVVMAYFVGSLANTLPLPGGIGGVDGGMIGTLVAFGVDPGLAVVGVLAFRFFAFWLPTIPGAIAYIQLRHTVDRWKLERQAERDADAAGRTGEIGSAPPDERLPGARERAEAIREAT